MKNKNIYQQRNTNEYLLDAWWDLAMSIVAFLGFGLIALLAWVLDHSIYMKLLALAATATFFIWTFRDLYRIYRITQTIPLDGECRF